MENKINIAELLKDCPKGMELDCTMFENLEFDEIVNNSALPIRCRLKSPNGGGYNIYNFTKYGCWDTIAAAKCVIFPKGKTTWERFVPPCPFKDGDVLAFNDDIIVIFKDLYNKTTFHSYCHIEDGVFSVSEKDVPDWWNSEGFKLANKEHRDILFAKMKEAGYKWNEETKTLEKLPKFKVGDRIRNNQVNLGNIYTIVEVGESSYVVNKNNENCNYHIDFVIQDYWELVPNKFDINTLKPFDKVLVRDSDTCIWKAHFFNSYCKNSDNPYICIGLEILNEYKQCIPYDSNKELFNTTNDCDDFYKTWKK